MPPKQPPRRPGESRKQAVEDDDTSPTPGNISNMLPATTPIPNPAPPPSTGPRIGTAPSPTTDDTTQRVGFEEDPVIRRFGHLTEGFQMNEDTNEADRQRLRDRYQERRNVAELAFFPEGWEFRHQVGDEVRGVLLLTPPDMVAVVRADGTWYRRPREVEDDPAPYTFDWYMEYIRENSLPTWFMRPEVNVLRDNHEEAQWLGFRVANPIDPDHMIGNNATIAPPVVEYLNIRYPQASWYPEVIGQAGDRAHAFDLSDTLVTYIARRFPAILANRASSNNRVFLYADGHIRMRVVRGRPRGGLRDGETAVQRPAIRWISESDDNVRASYQFEDRLNVGNTLPPPISRDDEINLASARGDMVNEDWVPHGPGEWVWLNEEIDQRAARALGFDTPVQVHRARQAGMLAGMGSRATPIVAYRSDTRFINPAHQPSGPGHWEYITTGGTGSSEQLAWLNFGGQDAFPNNNHPTAADIWNLRQQVRWYVQRGELDEDFTSAVDLVWVPGVEEAGPDPSLAPSLSPAPSPPNLGLDINHDRQDPDSLLFHEPLNRGENDQTGIFGRRQYQTIEINGRKYTVDRSRCHANNRQDHKSWAVTSKGEWKQWPGYATLDWKDRDAVEKLNKWREQVFGRKSPWPNKRKEPRVGYTDEQRRWVFDHIQEASGGVPSMGIRELTRRYNERFPNQARVETGIQGLVDRLRKEYKDYGGRMKPKAGDKRKHQEDEDGEGGNDEGGHGFDGANDGEDGGLGWSDDDDEFDYWPGELEEG